MGHKTAVSTQARKNGYRFRFILNCSSQKWTLGVDAARMVVADVTERVEGDFNRVLTEFSFGDLTS